MGAAQDYVKELAVEQEREERTEKEKKTAEVGGAAGGRQLMCVWERVVVQPMDPYSDPLSPPLSAPPPSLQVSASRKLMLGFLELELNMECVRGGGRGGRGLDAARGSLARLLRPSRMFGSCWLFSPLFASGAGAQHGA